MARPLALTGPYEDFARELRALMAQKGLTFRQLAATTHYSVSTLAESAGGRRLPTLRVTLAIVEACGGDVGQWRARWTRLREELNRAGDDRPLPADPAVVHPAQVSTPAEFAAALRALQRKSGQSYADLERSSSGQLARSTISNMLTGQTMPSWDTVDAFITACGTDLPPGAAQAAADLGGWHGAWRRASRARAAANPAAHALRRTPVAGCDPYQLGVHRAPVQGGDPRLLPAYVHRGAAEEELRHVLEEARSSSGFILLVGEAGSGKTRLAYETVRSVLPDFGLLHPADAGALTEAPPARTIIWLDDLDRYLHSGLTRATLQSSLQGPGPVVVLGTIWPSQYHSCMTLPRIGAAPDTRQREREVLTLATVIDVDVRLSRAELDSARAAAGRDPRIAAALNSADHGIFQNLAAGPHLARRWNHAANPYAEALITAAVDARRAGFPDPLNAGRLKEAAAASLTPAQRAQAPADWFEQAVSYATAPVPGGVAVLTPVSTAAGTGRADGYHVADFLLSHQETRSTRPDGPPGRLRGSGSNAPGDSRATADRGQAPPGASAAAGGHEPAGQPSNHVATDGPTSPRRGGRERAQETGSQPSGPPPAGDFLAHQAAIMAVLVEAHGCGHIIDAIAHDIDIDALPSLKDFPSLEALAAVITPVPGCLLPGTRAAGHSQLLRFAIDAARMHEETESPERP
jgi:lambda repressor-like predicted transcriptional regulator